MPHKKDHTWKDALGGQLINKGKLAISKKVKEIDASDSSWHNKIKNQKISKNIESGKTASGRIQKKLVESGMSKTQLRKAGEKNKAFKDNRKKMDAMRKNNPEKYRKLKKKQRKESMAKSLKSNSSTWD